MSDSLGMQIPSKFPIPLPINQNIYVWACHSVGSKNGHKSISGHQRADIFSGGRAHRFPIMVTCHTRSMHLEFDPMVIKLCAEDGNYS